MLSKQRFKRLTIVLVAPLLALGFWLASSDVLFPNTSVVFCDESASDIFCTTHSFTERTPVTGNGAVKLAGARLTTGFNHIVVVHPFPTSSFVDGKWVVTPPTTAAVRKTLRLPPASTGDIRFASCWLDPSAENAENPELWIKTCAGFGADDYSETFTFADEKNHQKFHAAASQIRSMKAENAKREAWVAALLFVTPLLAYLALTAALILFARVVRYVVHGRQPALE